MSIERRRAPRYQFVAEAEIIDPLSNLSMKGQTSDVSLVGCFIRTTHSLPPGTEVQLQLKYKGTTLKARGLVVRPEPSMGFGVNFLNIKSAQEMLLQKWFAGLVSELTAKGSREIDIGFDKS